MAMAVTAFDEKTATAAYEGNGKPEHIDTICFTIAKAACREAQGKTQLQRALNIPGVAYERDVKARMWNDILIYSADSGSMQQAEDFKRRLDARCGYQINIRAMSALVRAYVRERNFERADELFKQVLEPVLHPELGNVRPDRDFFHYMVALSAEGGEIALAERHFREMARFDLRPSLRTFRGLVLGCVGAGQTRRANKWMEVLVKDGCAEVPSGFPPDVVREEREYQQRSIRRHWKIEMFDALVTELAQRLADEGYAQSANRWLGYLVECGVGPESAPDVWDHVRSKHPLDIIPTLVSGETMKAYASTSPVRGAPSVMLPARLKGEVPYARGCPVDELDPGTVAVWGKASTPRHGGRRGTLETLAEALREGEKVGLDEEELRPVRTILAVEERRARSKAALEEALASGDTEALRYAIGDAEASGLSAEHQCLTAARAALEREERKDRAREKIQDTLKVRGLPPLPLPSTPRLPKVAAGQPPAPTPEPPPTLRSLAGRTAHSAFACTAPLPPRAVQKLGERPVHTFRRPLLRA